MNAMAYSVLDDKMKSAQWQCRLFLFVFFLVGQGFFMAVAFSNPVHIRERNHPSHVRLPVLKALNKPLFLLGAKGGTGDDAFDLKHAERAFNSTQSASEYRELAAKLKERARALANEVKVMEATQKEKKEIREEKNEAITQEMLGRFFPDTSEISSQYVSEVIEKENMSVEQLMPIVRKLFLSERAAISVNNTKELQEIASRTQTLLHAAELLDTKFGTRKDGDRSVKWSGRGASFLSAQLRDLVRAHEETLRRDSVANVTYANTNTSVLTELFGTTASNASTTQNGTNVAILPYWVPLSLLPYILAAKTLLDPEDIAVIREGVLPKSRFYCTSHESVPVAAIFRGNVRSRNGNSTSTSELFEELQMLLGEHSLSSRVQFFLLPDPEWIPNQETDELQPKPVIVALPESVSPDDSRVSPSRFGKLGQIVMTGLTVLTIHDFASHSYLLNTKVLRAALYASQLPRKMSLLPIILSVLSVHMAHEGAQWFMARRRGLTTGRRIPIPSLFHHTGLLGCITPLRSFPKDRTSLFDWAISGPLTGLTLSMLLMVYGLIRTVNASQAALVRYPVVALAELKSSFLASSLLLLFAPKVMMLPNSLPIPLHPTFLAGFSGLIASALNLLPVFRLDGGRACTAILGRRTSAIASSWTLLMMLSAALSGSGMAVYWGMIILFFHGRQDIPVRDDVTKVRNGRIAVWIACLATSFLALLPYPNGLGLTM